MPCAILQAPRTIDYKSAPFLMTAGLENTNAELIIWFTWHFHSPLSYYSLLAMQFELSHLRLKCLLVLRLGEKSRTLKWQMLTDHVAIKNLRPTTFCLITWRKRERKQQIKLSRIGHGLYLWKYGHFTRLNRTQWPGFVSAGVIFKK